MRGWKTWTGATMVGLAAALEFLGYGGIAEPIQQLGAALTGVGIAHKIQKIKE